MKASRRLAGCPMGCSETQVMKIQQPGGFIKKRQPTSADEFSAHSDLELCREVRFGCMSSVRPLRWWRGIETEKKNKGSGWKSLELQEELEPCCTPW